MLDAFRPENVITLDFETHFGKKIKLGFSCQSTEEYVRDHRWRTHGVGIKKGFDKTYWLYGPDKVAEFFAKTDLSESTLLAHHSRFEGFVLSQHYDVRPKYWLDTRSMAPMIYGNNLRSAGLGSLTRKFLPGEVKDQTALFNIEGRVKLTAEEALELGEYCRGDCDKTHMLYTLFLKSMQPDAIDFNLLTIDMVTKMFTDPVLELDPQPLVDLIATESAEKQAALDLSVATSMKQIRSNPQFATLLESQGVEVPMKISPTTDKETFAFAKTDRPLLELLDHEDEAVRNLVAARLRIKTSINETRAQKYLDVADRGTWPVDLNISGARTTHRLSGSAGGGGNPQNLGKKSKLRYAIKAALGFTMFAVDSSAIELRVAMVLAGEWEVVNKLRNPDFDLYRLFAAHLYGKELPEVTYAERLIGKIAMLSLQYGTGWEGFMQAAFNWGVTIEPEEAMRIVSLYRAAFPKIVRAWRNVTFMLKELIKGEAEEWGNDNIVYANPTTPAGCAGFTSARSGLSITYPNLRWERNEDDGRREMVYSRYDKETRRVMDTRIWGSKAFENICQFCARDVVFEQQLELDTHLKERYDPQCKTVMSIHDESLAVVPDTVPMKRVLADAEIIFGKSPDWWPELPVFGEAHSGENYATCK